MFKTDDELESIVRDVLRGTFGFLLQLVALVGTLPYMYFAWVWSAH